MPVMVRGRVVHWIDSKAMYGDATAWKYAREQVDHYVACFGTGMVIFWFGADDDVGDLAGPSVLVLGSFPKGEEVT